MSDYVYVNGAIECDIMRQNAIRSINENTFSGLILTDVKELDTPLHRAFHKYKKYSFVYQIIFI